MDSLHNTTEYAETYQKTRNESFVVDQISYDLNRSVDDSQLRHETNDLGGSQRPNPSTRQFFYFLINRDFLVSLFIQNYVFSPVIAVLVLPSEHCG